MKKRLCVDVDGCLWYEQAGAGVRRQHVMKTDVFSYIVIHIESLQRTKELSAMLTNACKSRLQLIPIPRGNVSVVWCRTSLTSICQAHPFDLNA